MSRGFSPSKMVVVTLPVLSYTERAHSRVFLTSFLYPSLIRAGAHIPRSLTQNCRKCPVEQTKHVPFQQSLTTCSQICWAFPVYLLCPRMPLRADLQPMRNPSGKRVRMLVIIS